MCVFHSGSRQCSAIPGTDTNWNSHYQRGKESVWICLVSLIDQFRYIKIQPRTIDLSTRLWGINTVCGVYSPEPRSEVYCLRLKIGLFDLDYCQVLHEPLAWVIPQALPVFDIKFTFIYVLYTTGFTHFDRPSNLSYFRTLSERVWFADKSLRLMLSFGWRQINPRDNCIGLNEL